jgi:UDP-glucose 4-epimerase
MGITVAVTGPTGEIGISAVTALEREPAVCKIDAMARRPFEPPTRGWTKTSYHQGDILDRDAVDALVAQADVVVHLAFPTMGSCADVTDVTLQGARNVFEATVAAGRPRRLVYTSSVAAYGYHSDNPVPLTEDVPVRGSAEHYYSEQRAACEAALADITKGSSLDVFVLRTCLVAGPQAPALANVVKWRRLPAPVRAVAKAVPMLKPVVPDPGFPLQLVHHDDVAAAIALAAAAPVRPGVYNIAGTGEVSIADVAKALGGRSVRVPATAASAASAAVSRLPVAPAAVNWLHVARTSVVMDTGKARQQLGWRPTHSSAETLAALAQAV